MSIATPEHQPDLAALKETLKAVREAFPGEWNVELLGVGWVVMDADSNEVATFPGMSDDVQLAMAQHVASLDVPTLEALVNELERWQNNTLQASIARLESLSEAQTLRSRVKTLEEERGEWEAAVYRRAENTHRGIAKDAMTRAAAAEAKLERLNSWHQKGSLHIMDQGKICTGCGQAWPCDTRCLLDGGS